jgi:hypothetical protein
MDADRLIAIARNPSHVIGIFNYCDRWCERCLFTDRCLQYQTEPHLPEPQDEHERDRLTLEYVGEQFALMRESLQRKMEEFGLPMPTPEELSRPDPEAEACQERVRAHPVLRAAMAYRQLVEAWFQSEREALCGKAENLIARVEGGDDGQAVLMEASQVKNALEIIEYDWSFLHPKLNRALEGRAWEAAYPDFGRDPVQNDSNGSAKVALISIDRSEAAWRLIAEWTDTISTAGLLADSLAQLRSLVEEEFPDARRFVRPGFDQVPR